LEDSVRRYCEHLRRTATAENVDSLISGGDANGSIEHRVTWA
jgi:hypothetical protein